MCSGLENKTEEKNVFTLSEIYGNLFFKWPNFPRFEIGKTYIYNWEKIANFSEGKQPNIGGILAQKKSLTC